MVLFSLILQFGNEDLPNSQNAKVGDTKKKTIKKKAVKKTYIDIDDSSVMSAGEVSDICDDNEFDDEDLTFVPADNAPPNKNCCVCGEAGKSRELWYRCTCTVCASWNHADCTDANSAHNYIR